MGVDVRVISTSTIHAPNYNDAAADDESSHNKMIDLTPWDLQFLPFGVNQKGLLYHHPVDDTHTPLTPNQIHHLKHSLTSTLSFFPPFTGRLIITEHEEDNTISCSIACNNAGALFIHATAEKTCVADILGPTYLPPIFHSFFPLNGVRNYEGTSQPLLAVQVTQLVDGIFIGCTINHVVVDGKSIWHFINSWAQISKGLTISKVPSFERWFPNGIEHPIRFPFSIEASNSNSNNDDERLNPPERLFHFKKEKIVQLKAKANIEAGAKKVSSLQALFTHLWRSVIRSKRLDPNEEVHYVVVIGVRPRLVPPLQEDYFGNAMIVCGVTMKAGELLEEGGLGKGASEMHKMIGLHSDEKLKNHYESWLKTPNFIRLGSVANSNSLVTSSSPWFDVYGNDFGWGKPVGVRSGAANKRNGKISVFAGAEEGSMDLEVCLPYEILEAIGNDPEFMDVVSK